MVGSEQGDRAPVRAPGTAGDGDHRGDADGAAPVGGPDLLDELTGLGNDIAVRRRFDQDEGRPATLVLLDCLRFCEVNRAHGHAAGDAVLVQAARALEQAAPARARLARCQGDHFLVLVPDRVPAAALAHDLAAAAAVPLPSGDRLRLSVGAASGTVGEELLRAADEICAGHSKRQRRQDEREAGAGA